MAVNNTMEPFVFSFISPLESILLFLQTKLRTHNNCLFTQFNVSILIIDHSKDSDQCFGWFVFFLWRCAVTSLGPGHARGSFLIDVGKFGRKIKYLSFQVLVIKYVVTILMHTVVKKFCFFTFELGTFATTDWVKWFQPAARDDVAHSGGCFSVWRKAKRTELTGISK